MADNSPLLQTTSLGIRFGAFTAVEDVNFQISRGESVGIIGPNGAGKSTFFNMLTGLHSPTWGQVSFNGNDISGLTIEERVHLGLVRTFQLVSVFDSLSVFDNISMSVIRSGPFYDKKGWFMFGTAMQPDIFRISEESLSLVGLKDASTRMTGELSYGDRRKLEIGMALALKPKLLLLDEPFAGLSDVEITEVVRLIKQLKGQMTLIIIEHKISRILDLVGRLSVMSEGHLIAEGLPDDVLCDPEVRRVYWGDDPVCEPASLL